MRNYDVFLDVLKFSLKNDDNIEFKRFSLVNTLNQLLKELEERVDKIFHFIEDKPDAYEVLLKSIFRENGVVNEDELEEYRQYINSSSKKELVRRFGFLMHITDCSMEWMEGLEVGVIDVEIRRVKNFLQPLLVVMSTTVL